MATTIPSAFAQLKSNLEITSLQQTTVSERQQNVRDCISDKLNVLNSFLTGSYARSTMIAPLSEADIDMFIVLDPSYYSSTGYTTILDNLRNILSKRYSTTTISRNGQAVTIKFNDFLVDVVPSFYRKDGGYLIPSTTQKSWISTDPTLHISYISDMNKAHNGDLIPMIKMLKGWNRNIGGLLSSFYLELIAANIYDNVTISDFWSGSRYFFDKGKEKVKFQAKDPVPYGGNIPGLNFGSVENAVLVFMKNYNIAIKAEAYASEDNIRGSIDEWKKIFGSYFPSYG